MTMPTFTDGAFVRQATLNALSTGINNLSLLLTGVPAPRAYVPASTAKITSTKALANTTDTVITFDSAGVNNDAIWTVGQQPFATKTGGVYIAWAQACFTANATGVRVAHILLNGTAVVNSIAAASEKAPSGTDLATINLETPPMYLAPGATLYFSAWQSSGGSLTLSPNTSGTFMSVVRIGNS